MDCDWVFLNSDGSKMEVTLVEQSVPNPGNGKVHQGIGYHIRYVINGATTTPNPIVIATEHS
jgi:hypothetical protein